MPIPGFSLVPPPEIITAAEAVGMVMERFKSSACTEGEACGWLSEQVRHSQLKLFWKDMDPKYPNGLYLAGEGFIYISGFPGARAFDEIDWSAGELRRRLRAPKPAARGGGNIDPFKLSADVALARYGYGYRAVRNEAEPRDEPEEWVTDELTYRFTVKRASLVAIFNAVPEPLSEAAEISLAGSSRRPALRIHLASGAGLPDDPNLSAAIGLLAEVLNWTREKAVRVIIAALAGGG